MGWSAIVAADLEFAADTIEAWKALAIHDEGRWGPLTAATPPTDARTVGEALSQLEPFDPPQSGAPWDILRVRWDASTLRIRGCLNEDDYRSIGRDLALAVRAAQKVGARGQYLVLADDNNDGERTIVDERGSRVEPIVLLDVFSGAATGPLDVDYAAVVNEILAEVATAVSAPPVKKAAKKTATKKTATKKTATKKTATKKTATKKTATKKRG